MVCVLFYIYIYIIYLLGGGGEGEAGLGGGGGGVHACLDGIGGVYSVCRLALNETAKCGQERVLCGRVI